MPERETTGHVNGVEPGEVIDSVVLSDTPRGIVDTMMARLPSRFYGQDEAQPVIDRMRQAEKRYLPLARDLAQNRLGDDLQRHLARMMGILFLVGLLACLNLAAGAIAFLGAAVAFGVYLAVRWRVIADLQREARTGRDEVVRHWMMLSSLEKRWMEQEKSV
jgi:hypothetical protein